MTITGKPIKSNIKINLFISEKLYIEKSYNEIPLKKVVYNQSVPHLNTPSSPFVSGRESILP